MLGIDGTVRICSNEARINNYEINKFKLLCKQRISQVKSLLYNYFNDVLISRCTHEPFKTVRELGLPKAEIKVKNYYTFQGKFSWQIKNQIFFCYDIR